MTETKVLDLTKLTEYNTKLKNKIRWFGLKDDYDAIAVKDPNTIYFITDTQKIIRDNKSYGLSIDIHRVSAEPASSLGNAGDFAIQTDTAASPNGTLWYKMGGTVWTNITGARLDEYNVFSMGAKFGGGLTLEETPMALGGEPELTLSKDNSGTKEETAKYCTDQIKQFANGTWYSLKFPEMDMSSPSEDIFAMVSTTQPKVAFSTDEPDPTVGNDGDLYVKYTLSGTTVSEPKLYGKILGVWYLLGGGGGTMESAWSDTSTDGLQNKVITGGVKHCYSDGNTDTGVLPSGMKSITSGDSFPTTMNEGDIFLKHRGAGYDYVISTDIINDLTTGGTDKVLSAEMGKTLQTTCNTLNTNKVNVSSIVNNVTSTTTNAPLSANMGKYIYDTFNTSQSVSLTLTPDSGWTTSNAYAHKIGPNAYLVRFRAQYSSAFSESVKFGSSCIKVNGLTPSKGQIMQVAAHSSRVMTNLVYNSSGNWWFNTPTGKTTASEDLYCEGVLYAY